MFKNNRNTMIIIITAVTVVLIILTLIGVDNILNDTSCASCAVYNAIAFGVIMLWSCIFIGYFIWASYFYNLNYGVSKKVWEKIEKAKSDKTAGKRYSQELIDDEPLYNPYGDQTFGLPPGTVRGMIAFTLLFGAIALLIVSFGIKSEIEPGNFFRDQFEFFKTAFLMMVAFYFGSKSLKFLKGEQPLLPYNTTNSQRKATSTGTLSTKPSTVSSPQGGPKKNEVIVIDPSDPLGKNKISGTMPPITAIDPMAAPVTKSTSKSSSKKSGE